MSDAPTADLLYGPDHQRVVGRIVIGCSRIDAVAANIAARLRGDNAEALHRLGPRPPRQVRAECRKLVDRQIRGRLHRDVMDWLDRADGEA
jgi:hypothetical protein